MSEPKGAGRSEVVQMMLDQMRERRERELCSIPSCQRRVNRDVKLLRLCYEHGLEVARKYEPRILADARRREVTSTHQRVERKQTEAGNREEPVVYYARIGDYIKIGYSTRLRNRLNTLRVDELLAVEPGGADLERQRHNEFMVERIDRRRENFHPSSRLAQHIATLREQHDLPRWASLPRTSVITHRTEEA